MEHSSDPARHRYLTIRLAAFTTLWLLAGAYLWIAVSIPPPVRPSPVAASTFPTIVGVGMLIAATGMLGHAVWEYLSFRRGREEAVEVDEATAAALAEEPATSGPHGEEVIGSRWRLLIALGSIAAYALLFFPLGYLVSSLAFLIGTIYYFWRRLVWALVIGAALTLAIGWVFSALGVRLPAGLLPLPF